MLALINQYALEEYELGDNAVTAAKLNTPSIEVVDDTLYTWAGVALVAGPEAAEMLRVALEQNGMGWAVHQFGGTGLQLTNPLVKQAIESFILAGIPLQPLIDATEYLISPAMQSLGREVTEEEIFSFRLTQLKANLNYNAREVFNAKIRQYADLVAQWDGLTPQPELSDV